MQRDGKGHFVINGSSVDQLGTLGLSIDTTDVEK